jgi:hypothetical protein
MTEHTFGDPLGDDDTIGDDEPEALGDAFDAPNVLAIVAFVLAVLSFAGFGLMNGSAYVTPEAVNEAQTGRLVFSLIVGAALALVPVGLGWHAASRTLEDDPSWVATLARSAMLIGLASMLLRLVIAVIQASQDGAIGYLRL